MSKSPKDHLSKRSFLYICIMDFSGNLYKVWRFCPTCIYFCIKGGYHRVTSDGELDMGCLASGTDFSPFSELCTLPWLLMSHPFFPHVCPLCTSEACTWFVLSGPSPSAFLASFSSLFSSMPFGASFKAMPFLIQSGFQASFLQQKVFLPSWSFHFSWGSGRRVWPNE